MDKVKVTSDNKIGEDPLRTNLNAKVYLHVISSDLEQKKTRSGSHRKGAVEEI